MYIAGLLGSADLPCMPMLTAHSASWLFSQENASNSLFTNGTIKGYFYVLWWIHRKRCLSKYAMPGALRASILSTVDNLI